MEKKKDGDDPISESERISRMIAFDLRMFINVITKVLSMHSVTVINPNELTYMRLLVLEQTIKDMKQVLESRTPPEVIDEAKRYMESISISTMSFNEGDITKKRDDER